MTPAGGYIPIGLKNWVGVEFFVREDGSIGDGYIGSPHGLRPVINIRSDMTITGKGTMTDPYVVN